jgi:flagellin
MSSGITLTAAVRQNLLSLQQTAALMSETQNRLATGKKVNSALDNPSNFFTSQSLSNRASDLNALLDSIGQAQQTLSAADQGITSLTKLVQSAKSIAQQARQAAGPASSSYGAISVTGTPQTETLASTTGGAFSSPTANGNLSITVSLHNGQSTTLSIAVSTTDTVTDVRDAINNAIAGDSTAQGHVVASVSGGALKLDAQDSLTNFTINANTQSADVGLTADASTNTTATSTSLLDRIVANGGAAGSSSLFVTANGGSAQQITFGYGAGQVATIAQLDAKLATLSGVTASANSSTVSFSVASSSSQNSLGISASTGVAMALGLSGSAAAYSNNQTGSVTATTPDATRASLQSDFNNVLSQIDSLAKDASYNGINLLNGDNLKVVFNEKGTSSLNITGVTFDSNGLGLSAATGQDFQDNNTVDGIINGLNTALSTLRTQASKFGSNLTTVQTRQDFTKNLINTLQTGADNLVLADTNEEGANLLALQTRQQLSTTALSLSSQASQAVLRLFG